MVRSRLGTGQLSPLAERQSELARIRAERESVEAEIAQLRSGAPPSVSVSVTAAKSAPRVVPSPSRKKKVPVGLIVGAGIAGFFVLRSLRGRRR